ncbi:hypothetical protein H4R24_005436 [Coemansia sp. RSA 988]|nr:hypothetical protein H4R24_005436 [Coemansia sp. RSA 988]
MHEAHNAQDSICSQAAKYGQIAKDKEKQRLDEKNNKGKKKLDVPTSSPKDINDLNSVLESATSGVEKHPESISDANPDDTRSPINSPHNPASGVDANRGAKNSGTDVSHASGNARKGVSGGDSEVAAESGAITPTANVLLALCSIGLAGMTNMIPFY